jgi:hypothetical protein
MQERHLAPHRGAMILVFGILGILGWCIIFSILAWVFGNADLAEMDAGRMDPSGRGLTNAGRILGMISCILAILAVVILLLVVVGGVAAG